MKKLFSILTLLTAIAFNAVMGATVAPMLDLAPQFGAIGLNLVSVFAGGFMPSGVMGAGLAKEVWTGFMNKAFKISAESVGWYNRIRSFDNDVQNDVIHFVNIGGNPNVLINNTTYPIGITDIADADKPIGLDKYQTERTVISDDVLDTISYDIAASHVERHKDAIEEAKYRKALHSLAPNEHKNATPVLLTTGALVDGRRKLVKADLSKLKKAFDKQRVPLTDRILVLCPDHSADLIDENENVFKGTAIDETTGKIGRIYGFDIYEYLDAPYYTVSTKKELVFGAIPAETDEQASIAFAVSKCMRADGTLKFYYTKAENNPSTQQSEMNYAKRSICLPFKDECRGAIVSAKA